MAASESPKANVFLVCTWNVGDKKGESPPPSLEQLTWLSSLVSENAAEVVAIGVQELSPDAVSRWSDAFLAALPAGFTALLADASDSSCNTYFPLFIFAKGEAATACPVNDALTDALRYDQKGGSPAQKGCVVATLQCGQMAVRFVNCHLQHAYTGLDRRNEQQRAVQERFAATSSLPEELATLPTVLVELGDLNYRIIADGECKQEPTKQEPQGDEAFEKNFPLLVEISEAGRAAAELWPARDQLQQSLSAGLAFQEYEEAPVKFSPTYKRVPPKDGAGPVVFDQDERRLPGWCDRVLWRHIVPGATVSSSLYDAMEMVTWTDHRPVVNVLRMSVGSPQSAS